jgi:hypothetical protein
LREVAMTRRLTVAVLSLAGLLMFVPSSFAYPGGGFRGGFGHGFRGGYIYGYSPGFYYPWWGWGGYGWYGPDWYGGYAYVPSTPTGKVKIKTKEKDAEVFVDGGYAGTVKQLGTFKLKTGKHQLELRHPDGQTFYHEEINVLRGSTIDIKR